MGRSEGYRLELSRRDREARFGEKYIEEGKTRHVEPEQTARRALRSFERRGLVELGRYVFFPEPVMGHLSAHIVWRVFDPDSHLPGETRSMTGVRVTALVFYARS